MADNANEVQPEKVEEKVTDDQQRTPSVEDSAEVKPSEEDIKLDADKAKLEADIATLEDKKKGLEGTNESLLGDINRNREERRADPISEESIMDKLTPKIDEQIATAIKPLTDDNAKLKEELVKSNDETLKAKQAHLESVNARMASATAPSVSGDQPPEKEPEVELPPQEAALAKEQGLKNPRYLKDTHVFGI